MNAIGKSSATSAYDTDTAATDQKTATAGKSTRVQADASQAFVAPSAPYIEGWLNGWVSDWRNAADQAFAKFAGAVSAPPGSSEFGLIVSAFGDGLWVLGGVLTDSLAPAAEQIIGGALSALGGFLTSGGSTDDTSLLTTFQNGLNQFGDKLRAGVDNVALCQSLAANPTVKHATSNEACQAAVLKLALMPSIANTNVLIQQIDRQLVTEYLHVKQAYIQTASISGDPSVGAAVGGVSSTFVHDITSNKLGPDPLASKNGVLTNPYGIAIRNIRTGVGGRQGPVNAPAGPAGPGGARP